MLDFIILGIIPGTSFTLTLGWVLLLMPVALLTLLLFLGINKPKKMRTPNHTHPTINLDTLDLAGL